MHHDFWDFFAAVHILHELEMEKNKGIPAVLQERALDFGIRRLIGELEGEYRSKPYLTGDGWRINIDKENRLHRMLDIVPNSSSSSFIILCKEELTREKLYEIFRVSKDYPLYDLLKDIADTIFSKASRTTKEEIQQGYDEIPGKYADIPGKDYHWYHGQFEDEGMGSGGAEAFLCATDLNFENEDFIMIYEGGY